MAERGYLGEFELMILLAVLNLGDEAYGVPISRELEAHRGRDVSVGSVYAALERLETKGLVASSLGDPTPERGRAPGQAETSPTPSPMRSSEYVKARIRALACISGPEGAH